MSVTLRDPADAPELLTPTTAPALPRARGPISAALFDLLAEDWPIHLEVLPDLDTLGDLVDPLSDDDLQLALHVIYELSYRGFAGVDDRWDGTPPSSTSAPSSRPAWRPRCATS